MVVNSRENANTIVLRKGKEVEILVKEAPTLSNQEKQKNVVADRNIPNDDKVPKRKFPPLSNYKPVPPFLRLQQNQEKVRKLKIYMRLFVDAR